MGTKPLLPFKKKRNTFEFRPRHTKQKINLAWPNNALIIQFKYISMNWAATLLIFKSDRKASIKPLVY